MWPKRVLIRAPKRIVSRPTMDWVNLSGGCWTLKNEPTCNFAVDVCSSPFGSNSEWTLCGYPEDRMSFIGLRPIRRMGRVGGPRERKEGKENES